MGRSQKQKGYRTEAGLVRSLQNMGFSAQRVPLSGALGGSMSGDIDLEGFKVEVKSRKNGEGFKVIEDWLGSNDFLFLKKDRTDPMVVMSWPVFINLLTEDVNSRDSKREDALLEEISFIVDEWREGRGD